MTARIDHVVTSGTFSLDGETHDVDNNVWVIGDDDECVVLDAPHDADAILELVGRRAVKAVVCTHAHDDHVRYARELADAVAAPVWLHPADLPVWRLTHDADPDGELADGQEIEVAGTTLRVLHTPGHSPGSCCVYASDLGAVFTGDTLFEGGPGATGRSFSSWDVILQSIHGVLFALPPDTRVLTGHGPQTTIGAERANVPPLGAPAPE